MEKDSQKNVVNHFEAGSNCQVFNGNITGCVFAMPGSTVTQQATEAVTPQDDEQPQKVAIHEELANSEYWQKLKDAGEELKKEFTSVGDKIKDSLKEVEKAGKEAYNEIKTKVIDGVKNAVNGAVDKVKEMYAERPLRLDYSDDNYIILDRLLSECKTDDDYMDAHSHISALRVFTL